MPSSSSGSNNMQQQEQQGGGGNEVKVPVMTPEEEAKAKIRFASQLNVDDWNQKIMERSANGGNIPLNAMMEDDREHMNENESSRESPSSSSSKNKEEASSSAVPRSGRWG